MILLQDNEDFDEWMKSATKKKIRMILNYSKIEYDQQNNKNVVYVKE